MSNKHTPPAISRDTPLRSIGRVVRSIGTGILVGCLLYGAFAVASGYIFTRSRLVHVTEEAFTSGALSPKAQTGDAFQECGLLMMQHLRRDNPFVNAIDTVWSAYPGTPRHPCEQLDLYITNDADREILRRASYSYPDYPFGARHLEALFLSIIEFQTARNLTWFLSYASVVVLLFGAWLNSPRKLVLILPTCLFLLFAFDQRTFGSNLTMAPGFYLGFLLLGLFLAAKRWFADYRHRLAFFGFIGAITGFFDSLHGAIPMMLSLTIVLNHLFYEARDEVMNGGALKAYWFTAVRQGITIFLGYLASYAIPTAARLIILNRFVESSNSHHFFGELKYRMSGVLDNHVISIADVVQGLWTQRVHLTGGDSATWLLGISVAVWIVAFCLLAIAWELRGWMASALVVDNLVIVSAAAGILAWYSAFPNHSYGHSWFMIRMIVLPASYGFTAALLTVRWHIRAAAPNLHPHLNSEKSASYEIAHDASLEVEKSSSTEIPWNQLGRKWGDLLLCLMFLPLLASILLDRRVWSEDEAYYGVVTSDLFRTLTHSPLEWPAAMVHALGARPPALVWLGQVFMPLGHAVQVPQSAILLFTLTTQLLSVLLLYRALAKLFNQNLPALLTACIMATGPLFLALTSRYFVEPLQAFSVVWVLALAAYRDRLSKMVLVLHIVAAISLGFLTKSSTPLYQLPIVVYLIYTLIRPPSASQVTAALRNHRAHLVAIAAAATLLVLGTAAWYFANPLSTHQLADSVWRSVPVVNDGSESFVTKTGFWITRFQRSFFWIPLAVFGIVMTVRAVHVRRSEDSAFNRSDGFGLLSVLWILVVLLSTNSVNVDSRFLLALFPYVACVVCWLLVHMRSRVILATFGALCIAQFLLVTGEAYGALAPMRQFTTYLQPLTRDDNALRDLMFFATNTPDASAEHGIFVGQDTPDFNWRTLSFYRAAHGQANTRLEGFQSSSSTDVEALWKHVRDGGFRYYLYRLDHNTDQSESSRVVNALFERVAAAPEFHFLPDRSNERMLIFESGGDGPRYSASDYLTEINAKTFQGVNPEGKSPYGLMEFPKAGDKLKGQILPVFGWMVSPPGIEGVEILLDGMHAASAIPEPREDVAKAYPDAPSGGFRVDLNVSTLAKGRHRVSVVAQGKDGSKRVLSDVPFTLQLE